MDISLETLLQRLVGRGTEAARNTPPKSDERQPTSIRLEPKTRHFLEAQAAALNTSLQSIIGMILDGVAETTLSDTNGKLRTLRERFFYVMQQHGLDLPDIVDVMQDFGFTLSALGSADRLLDLLTKPTITHVADVFGVEAAWLSASSDTIVTARGWYKRSHELARELIEQQKAGLGPQVLLLRRALANFERIAERPYPQHSEEEPVGIVVRLFPKTREGKTFVTYKLWEFAPWAYGNVRYQLKEIIAFCEHIKIPVWGHALPQTEFDNLRLGRQLPFTILKTLTAATWHPDDYAGFEFEIEKEPEEWDHIRKTYAEGLGRIAVKEGGAIPIEARPTRKAAAPAAGRVDPKKK